MVTLLIAILTFLVRLTSQNVQLAPGRAVAAYVRLSILKDDQTSTRRQAKGCRELARIRGFGDEIEVYEDIGSAWKEGVARPAYDRLIADIEAGLVGIVLIWKIDRLGRNLIEIMRFVKVCQKHDVKVVSLNDPFDMTSPIGMAIIGMLAIFAQLESDTIALRVKNAKEAIALAGGEHGGGHRRFGRHRLGKDRRDDDGLITPCPSCGTLDVEGICPVEADMIRDAAARVLTGESIPTLVREWQARGVKTPTGREWSVQLLGLLLTAPHLAGLRVHHGEVVADAQWDPIIDRPTHHALTLRATSRSRPPARRSYLLTGGILRCGRKRCGKPLVAHRQKGVRRYECAPPTGGGCGSLVITAEAVDDHVTELVFSAMSRPEIRRALREQSAQGDGETEVADLNAKLVAAEQQLLELAQESAHMSARAYALAATAQEKEIASLERQVGRAMQRAQVLDIPEDNFEDEWWKRDVTWRAAIVGALFEPIVVLPARRASNRVQVEERLVIIPRV